MDLLSFGRLVEKWRGKKSKQVEPSGNERRWSRGDLAEAAGLSAKNIQSIERGQVKSIVLYSDYVGRIAGALGLSERDKIEFYATAGLHYEPRGVPEERDELIDLISKIDYPASIRTPLLDFVAFNEHHYRFWRYTPESISYLKAGDLGANLLKVIFDERFQDQPLTRNDQGQEYVVAMFRASSRAYQNSKRYRVIRDEMLRNYPSFRRIWEASEPAMDTTDHNAFRSFQQRTMRLILPADPPLGYVKLVELQVPYLHLTEELQISAFVPLSESAAKYAEFSQGIERNTVTTFEPVSLD